jgi:hypothetical protein
VSPDEPSRPLPSFVNWPSFPFEGELKVKAYRALAESEPHRMGEPGGAACGLCQQHDDAFIWVDDDWRVSAAEPCALPVQVMLTTRAHLDLGELDVDLAGSLGQTIVRLDHALRAVPGVARVHVARWGDGGAHFHMNFFARPRGSRQMLGWCLPMWSMILEPTPENQWKANLAIVSRELVRGGGTDLLDRSK